MAEPITPLLLSIFYPDHNVSNLNKTTYNPFLIYLQELIKHKLLSSSQILDDNIQSILFLCQKLGLASNAIHNIYNFFIQTFELDTYPIIALFTRSYKYNTSIKKLLSDWRDDNSISDISIPQFIILNIIRDNKIQVDIQKKISLNTNNYWGIHSAIYYDGTEINALLLKDNRWSIFTNNTFLDVYMNNKTLVDTLKHNCTFVIYKLL